MLDRGASLKEYQFDWPTLDLAFAASALRAALVLAVIVFAAWGLSEAFKRLLRAAESRDVALSVAKGPRVESGL
jgi:hypothetical protein